MSLIKMQIKLAQAIEKIQNDLKLKTHENDRAQML